MSNLKELKKLFNCNQCGEIINFNETLSGSGANPLSIIFSLNDFNKYHISEDELMDWLKKTDLKITIQKNSLLAMALEFSEMEKVPMKLNHWKYMIENSDLSLIKKEKQIIKLKKIQSDWLNDEILSKIEINEKIKKNNKI